MQYFMYLKNKGTPGPRKYKFISLQNIDIGYFK